MKKNKINFFIIFLCSTFLINGACFAQEYTGDIGALKQAITDVSEVNSYTASTDAILDGNLNQINAKILSLYGSNHNLDGNNLYTGLTLSSLQTLTVKNFSSSNVNLPPIASIKNFYGSSGSAIFNSGIINIENNTFYNNTANYDGGAIYNTNKAFINNSLFLNNKTLLGYGGAIYNSGSAIITNGVFSSNSALSTNAGAIYNNNVLSVTGTTFSANDARYDGGAIYNTNSLALENTKFSNNSTVNGYGGAIYNSGSAFITDSEFLSNSAQSANGGAIYNNNILSVDGTTFSTNTAKYDGGVIYNTSSLNLQDIKFLNNATENGYGGAIYNSGSAFITNGEFFLNSAQSANGGAIYNNNILSVNGTTFSTNSAKCDGGAIYNTSGLNLSDGKFLNNSTANGHGGAIYNSGTASITNSEFLLNSAQAANGGAIYNNNVLTANSTIFSTNSAKYDGGATNNTGSIAFENSKFLNNSTINGHGGAVYNSGVASIVHSEFLSNSAMSANGGAVYNSGTATISGSTFYKNEALVDGGAIHNSNTLAIYNSSFKNNNSVTGYGGAIYNIGNLKIIADNYSSEFSENRAKGDSNAIYLDTDAKLYLTAINNGNIIFNDKIDSKVITNNIDINNPSVLVSNNYGQVEFNKNVYNSTISLYNGTMKLGIDNVLNTNSLNLYGGTIDMINNSIGSSNLNSLTFKTGSTTNLGIDVDLANLNADKLTATAVSSESGILNINKINLLSDSKGKISTINLADINIKDHIKLSTNHAMTELFKYNINYDSGSGNMNFATVGGGSYENYNPKILTQNISSIASTYSNQTQVYNEVLGRAEVFMSIPQNERVLMKCKNRYAYDGDSMVFSPTVFPEESSGFWFKQYSTFEHIPLSNGPTVSNIGYGTILGLDSKLKQLKHGIDGYLTAYTAYNGASQGFNGINIYQNGGVAGVSGTLYKGNFFTTVTANVGANAGTAHTGSGINDFTTLISGAAIKSGYNIGLLNEKLIIQPTYAMSYTFAKTFDYVTSGGVFITSDPLNAIQISPGIKIIGNLENGWQPYFGTNMVWNIMDSGRFYANETELPQMSVEPYIEYGFGVQRRWKSRLSGFAQSMIRNGGRNGISLQFGFRFSL